MAGNGKKADYEAMGTAIAKALAPQFTDLRNEIGALRGELQENRARLDQVNVRLDRIVDNTGGQYRRLEERVSRLEAKFFRDDTTS